jgi:hypothetical protein
MTKMLNVCGFDTHFDKYNFCFGEARELQEFIWRDCLVLDFEGTASISSVSVTP